MALLYPLTTERSSALIEMQNKMTFIVDEKDSKPVIAAAVEKAFGEKVAAVNVLHTFDGRKKAIVRFVKKGAAADVAAKLKLI
ncbi:MAG: 50S ribosomal protein L23 [Candidatus Micrarchaeota archaeon]